MCGLSGQLLRVANQPASFALAAQIEASLKPMKVVGRVAHGKQDDDRSRHHS
jgi:hypothetical protein